MDTSITKDQAIQYYVAHLAVSEQFGGVEQLARAAGWAGRSGLIAALKRRRKIKNPGNEPGQERAGARFGTLAASDGEDTTVQ